MMKKKLRDNGLSLAMFGFFAVFFFAQSVAGWKSFNQDRQDHQRSAVTYAQYAVSGDFWGSVFENWESEFLQMSAYVVLTVFLFQRGSSESKDPDKDNPSDEDCRQHQDDPDVPGPVKRGGWRLKLYENSLSLALFALFLFSFVGHVWAGSVGYSHQQQMHGQKPATVGEFFLSPELWFQSMQNWQSEFLAVGSIVVLSIWLRQKGSPESKPVAAPHSKTGEE